MPPKRKAIEREESHSVAKRPIVAAPVASDSDEPEAVLDEADYIEQPDEDNEDEDEDGGDNMDEDDEDVDGDGMNSEPDDDDDGGEISQGKRLPKSAQEKRLYRAPTNDELHQLKETVDLFKSNLFKMQVQELLAEITIDKKKLAPIDKALHRIKEILDSMADIEELKVADAIQHAKKQGVAIPFPSTEPPADAQYKLGFKKPSKLFIVGSYLLKSYAKNPDGCNVDIAVQMPSSLFQDKDHLNYRYTYKRAFYLAVLAAELGKSKHGFSASFQAFHDNRNRPVLVLKSSGVVSDTDFSKSGFQIRIFPIIPENTFGASRLAPGRNNVRPPGNQGDTSLPPTPRYNASLLMDSVMVNNLNQLHSHASACAAFRDASVLAKVWLQQRGFNGHHGTFNGFLWEMLMGYLLRTDDRRGNRTLGNSFSSYQLLKVTMGFLANHDFDAEPIFMTPNGKPLEDPEFSLEAFKRHFDVVIVDPSGKLNLASAISKCQLEDLQVQARISFGHFNDVAVDRFDSLFLSKVSEVRLQFDNVLRIPHVTTPPPSYKASNALDFPSLHYFILYLLPKLLKRGLTDRVQTIAVISDPLPLWPCSEAPPSHETLKTPIVMGLVMNSEAAIRVVDHGPSAEDEAASKEFRQLWGAKSELRRFKDGSILESVVWEESGGTLEDRSLIVSKIVAHLVERHIGLQSGKALRTFAGQLYPFVKYSGATVSVFQRVIEGFQKFSKQLRELEGLPLHIANISPISSGLRYASVFVPQPFKKGSSFRTSMYDPLECTIEFESSGRWPEDLHAIQQMKLAFAIKIAEIFKARNPASDCRVTRGSFRNHFDAGYLEIKTDAGWTFRCHIYADNEVEVIERALKNTSLGPEQIDAYTQAKNEHELCYIKRKYHTSRIAQLSLRHPFLPLTMRLVKRWVSAHLLSYSIPEEVLELITASVFVDSGRWPEPGGPFSGFFRVLDLLRTFNWKKEILVVELEKGMLSPEIRREIAEKFNSRLSDGDAGQTAGAFVATERDTEGIWWGVCPQMYFHRLRVLATASLEQYRLLISNGDEAGVQKLFLTPKTGYNAIIHLDPHYVPSYPLNVTFDPEADPSIKNAKFKNLSISRSETDLALDTLNPIPQYLAELRDSFGDVAMFFADRYGGDKIAVAWKGLPKTELAFKVNLGWNIEPATLGQSPQPAQKDKKKSKTVAPDTVKVNLDAMISEMYRLGDTLVQSIEVIS
ncbi:Nrap protein [Polychytrium aggregatum]|uniref:Nrap protein n=1 Tax=Polychytrium aggregatum TaxID=110093 RepID=UPI0022FE05E0|nr:Nrap protein [Polychytrium aggregatum]KAI9208235.1 Nrap protein [Polychytrium aggregatum]